MATAQLHQLNPSIRLSLAGRDPDGAITSLAKSLNLIGVVDFLGIVANDQITAKMREADVVVIPSRHEYPEGLPLTIYEALSARTPIVASDHSMFQEALIDGESAVIFPAGDVDGLTRAISRLLNDTPLYNQLSIQSERAWSRIQISVTMGELLQSWIADDPAQTQWIQNRGLMSGCYSDRISNRN